MRLVDKVVLVTGGSQGIGRAIAVRFAAEGAKVAVAGLGKEGLEETAAYITDLGSQAIAIEADVRYRADVDRMVDDTLREWGRIDVLVNNAGVNRTAPFLEITEEDWDWHLDINLKGTFLVSQRAAKEMVKQGNGGSIIQMSSVNGLSAEADQAHYNASKGGINLLAMSMAVELAPHGIRVNSLCPGFIETQLTKPLIDNPTAIAEYLKTIPMKRVGQPEDIASAALFMASDESRYMTGHCMVIDGGQLIKLS
ncbi:beta-ketoacyl-ACP reductase [Paenibacillus baekrokdamisoli]|uniref:Beta-ketoacyl-ACP reductase n=1 Tax=Paenibacillus baekrokdamisoli TaxID=1712516 RepID=A0A3G9IX96_9BACL|nr:SDR family oxidoreductase [Paenibacillus baekrokdamisoli]MBB3068668.1 NAD(P)-dependent dehydrogenase (short-subunit alcohol dehydrogenase family) [Paenibacillus baekrokdamisoli]BBH23500.1 beta-ketoacyl-ACP reductase [Paenibacillus baekrokdamisoli]